MVYRDAARHLQAMQAVLTKFEAYKDVAKVRSLVAQVEMVKETLKTLVFKDFHASFPPLVGNTNTQMVYSASPFSLFVCGDQGICVVV
jgi:hypothetical protein